MSDNKRKYTEISESSEIHLFDILNLDADESHYSLATFAKSLTSTPSMELFKNLNVKDFLVG